MGELEMRYTTGVDGVLTNVAPFDEAVRSIKAHIQSIEKRNKYLESENKRLLSEHYKDKEMAAMKESLDAARKDLNRGFPISEEEWKAIKEWQRKHEEAVHGADYENHKYAKSGAIGGSYTYKFIPTSIGTFGTCICSCGAEFDFQEA